MRRWSRPGEGPARGQKFIVAAANLLAVQAALAVVEPQTSGLGGGSEVVYFESRRHRVRVFDGLSRVPATVAAGLNLPTAAERHTYGVSTFDQSVDHAGRAVGVPGTVRVLGRLHHAYGNRPWDTLFTSARQPAATGFPVSRISTR